MYGNEESQLLLSDDRFDTATSEIEELLSKVKLFILFSGKIIYTHSIHGLST